MIAYLCEIASQTNVDLKDNAIWSLANLADNNKVISRMVELGILDMI